MRENRQSGSEGGGTKPIASPYPYKFSSTLRVETSQPAGIRVLTHSLKGRAKFITTLRVATP